MDDAAIYALLIGIAAAGGGVIAGHQGRYASHQMVVRRDLRFLILLPAELAAVAAASVVLDADATSMLTASLLIFDAFYAAGYTMADPKDTLGIETYNENLMRSFARPIAYYYRDGQLYLMDQTLGAAVRAKLGARDPLEMDMSKIVRLRDAEFTTGRRRPRELRVAAVAVYDKEEDVVRRLKFGTTKVITPDGCEIREPRYRISQKITRHKIDFADGVITDPVTYDTSVEVRDQVVRALMESKEKVKRLEVQLIGAQYNAAADLLQGIFDLDVDPILEEVTEMKERFRQKLGGS